MSVFTNRCRHPERECQTVYKILGVSKTVGFRTCTPHVFANPARLFAEMSCEGIAPQNSWNCYIPPNPTPRNQSPTTTQHPAYTSYSTSPLLLPSLVIPHICPATLLYMSSTYATPYYSSLIVCPPPLFFLSTYNFNCQTITMCPPCLFL